MGEIKSTLDLVMEKTRHLTLSQEEKQQQSRDAAQKQFNGLLQKYQDGLLSLEQLEEPMKAIQNSDSAAEEWMRAGIRSRIDPDQDNTLWLAILKGYFEFDCSDLEAVLEEYRSALAAGEKQRGEVFKDALAEEHHVSGPAVVPNLAADPQWISEKDGIRACFQEMLDRLIPSEELR